MGKTIGTILSLTNRFSPELKKVAKDLGKTEAEMKKAQKSVVDFQKQCSKAAGTLKTGLIAAFGTVSVASIAMVNKTLEAGDRIDKMSQKVGMSRKTFQELDYVFSQSGIQMDSFTTGAKKLSEAVYGVSKKNSESAKIFANLGVTVKDNKGHFYSQETILKKTLVALQKMPQGVNKAVYAQKLFGKQGMQLMPLLNSQSKGVEELIQKAHSLGMVMSDENVDAAVQLTDTLDTLKRSFTPLGMMFANILIPRIQSFSDFVLDNMPKIKETTEKVVKTLSTTIGSLAKNMDTLLPVTLSVVAAIVSFKTISGTMQLINSFTTMINTCKTAQLVWNASMLANPIGIVALGLSALVAGVVVAYNKFEGFRNVVDGLWSLLKLLGNNFLFTCQCAWKAIKPVYELTAKFTGLSFIMERISKSFNLLSGGGVSLKNWADTKNAQLDDYAKNTGVRKNALGTNYFAGGLTSINEGGKGEIVDLPSGTRIIPHDVAKHEVSKKQDIKLNITVQGNVIGNNEFLEQMAGMFTRELKLALAVV